VLRLIVSPVQLRLALKAIEQQESVGFGASLVVFDVRPDTLRGEFTDVIERYVNAKGQIINYGCGQTASTRVRIVEGQEIELSDQEQRDAHPIFEAHHTRSSARYQRNRPFEEQAEARADREELGCASQTQAEWEAQKDERLALEDRMEAGEIPADPLYLEKKRQQAEQEEERRAFDEDEA
jgi:hypothetical protein